MLESQRGFLLLAFAAVSFFLFLEWQDLQTVKLAPPAKPVPSSVLETIAINDAPALSETAVATTDVPDATAAEVPTADLPTVQPSTVPVSSSRYIEVTTDTLRVVIDRQGGDIVEADLLQYRQSTEENSPPVRILSQAGRTHIAQSGIIANNGPDAGATRAEYQSPVSSATMAADAETLDVPLSWTNESGVTFSKTYRFKRGGHAVELIAAINNQSSEQVNARLFAQLKRDRHAENGAFMGMSAYTGAAYGATDRKFEKYPFEDMDETKLDVKTDGGWVAYLQHYFISAWVPGSESGNTLYSRVLADKQSIIGLLQPAFAVAPGQSQSTSATLYVGPKIQDDLAKLASGLDLTVDYGFLWWIGQPLFWALTLLHSWVGNWGVAIILVTVVVKLLLYPLANAQYRSFAKMRVLAPKLQQLKERHGDDRQAMSQAMMDLYRKEKVNPLGGCLPLLITMPVFLALYWVLMESVELRHAPFMLWINDLSVMDPYYVLPILMGASMWFMQKLQPVSPTMDPMQQKMMQYLPVIMSVFFLWFPAGLVLYWLVNNLLSIAQQVYITKRVEAEAAKKK